MAFMFFAVDLSYPQGLAKGAGRGGVIPLRNARDDAGRGQITEVLGLANAGTHRSGASCESGRVAPARGESGRVAPARGVKAVASPARGCESGRVAGAG
jgi:hypothetical protein